MRLLLLLLPLTLTGQLTACLNGGVNLLSGPHRWGHSMSAELAYATAPDPVSLIATAGIGHYGHTARDVRHRDPVALALSGLRAGSWSLLSGGYFTSRTWRYLFRLEKAWWLSERYDVLLRLERLVVARRDGSGQYNFTVGLTHHFT